MADASEDSLRGQLPSDDNDPEEEIQDYSFLLTQAQKLPSRGVKDFEPHGTNLQQSTLDASRETMHIALSQTRFHGPDKSRAVYDAQASGALVFNPMGQWVKSVGKVRPVPGRAMDQVDGQGNVKEQKLMRMWLLPEEALWLVERGSLDLRYPSNAEHSEEEDEGLPMSLQGAYSAYIGSGEGKEGGLTLEQFTVYQYLKRCGYHVFRAGDNLHNIPRPARTLEPDANTQTSNSISELWKWLFTASAPNTEERGRFGPLVKLGLYRSYDEIYRQLLLIPFHDPRTQADVQPPWTQPQGLTVTWHVYKTDPKFKKTAPGPPDFYVSVVSARDTLVPTERELDHLLRQTPYHAPEPKDGLNKKLKTAYRDVVLAVVDQGVISFIDVSDSGFGNEKLWGREPKRGPGGKRGGHGKGGGRGRGRGRGRG
jgi:tRNA-splicing endonuclease subunit Sen54